MKYLVTGAGGFIGSHVCHSLLSRGAHVTGIDNLNEYYDPSLKMTRLRFLSEISTFKFDKIDVSDAPALKKIVLENNFDTIIHLAAQAGVRYSLQEPFAYAQSNLVGHLSVLEAVRHSSNPPFLIYASSSSVYGNSAEAPFCETERADNPESLYAATKRACELMSSSYTQVYGLSQVGLRFFTVYGPWGRPDMAYWGFAEKILSGEPINIFNHGDLRRDFTWIGDIVDGIVRIAERGPAPLHGQHHRIYNIGNNKPEKLMDFIATLEEAIGKKADKRFLPMQPGDVYETAADISAINADYGFEPKTSINSGLKMFADWFSAYRNGKADLWMNNP